MAELKNSKLRIHAGHGVTPSKKVLVVNRGEIALRIIRACRELSLSPIAVYSEADRTAPHVLVADEAYLLGPAPAKESYLHIPKLLEIAERSGATLLHPGYGFLSENAEFADRVTQAGIRFVGPSKDAIATMGSKAVARQKVSQAGVPCVPGYDGEDQSLNTLTKEAKRIGFPILLKPADGGGGKGMQIVSHAAELEEAIPSTKRMALSSFGSDRLILERYIESPRHVEIQVFGDSLGNVVHLFERECSIQRRHQKIIEETPCIALTPEVRSKMCQAAIAAAKSVQYQSAGTVEFLLDTDGSFYFLEMNTRLQVEHPVTEWVCGIDLVALQLRLALGEEISLSQEAIKSRGHSIEARIYAENPSQGFLPSVGKLLHVSEPAGAFIRVDSGIRTGYEVPLEYDPMLAKLSVWGETRAQAIQRLLSALEQYEVLGVHTNIAYLRNILKHPSFQEGNDISTHFLEKFFSTYEEAPPKEEALLAAALYETLASPTKHGTSASTEIIGGDPYSPWQPGAINLDQGM